MSVVQGVPNAECPANLECEVAPVLQTLPLDSSAEQGRRRWLMSSTSNVVKCKWKV